MVRDLASARVALLKEAWKAVYMELDGSSTARSHTYGKNQTDDTQTEQACTHLGNGAVVDL